MKKLQLSIFDVDNKNPTLAQLCAASEVWGGGDATFAYAKGITPEQAKDFDLKEKGGLIRLFVDQFSGCGPHAALFSGRYYIERKENGVVKSVTVVVVDGYFVEKPASGHLDLSIRS